MTTGPQPVTFARKLAALARATPPYLASSILGALTRAAVARETELTNLRLIGYHCGLTEPEVDEVITYWTGRVSEAAYTWDREVHHAAVESLAARARGEEWRHR